MNTYSLLKILFDLIISIILPHSIHFISHAFMVLALLNWLNLNFIFHFQNYQCELEDLKWLQMIFSLSKKLYFEKYSETNMHYFIYQNLSLHNLTDLQSTRHQRTSFLSFNKQAEIQYEFLIHF
jgi:hypothetical protein